MEEPMINELKNYCKDYNVPIEYFFEIIKDQKVIPMIRGKATEYNAYLYLKANLDSHVWSVEKLNLNAQNNEYDEDVSITHRASGIRLKVECKNACRGSFSDGKRTKILKVPHFKVKCHRSRSNKGKKTNDKYLVGEFDLLLSNTSNAIYKEKTDDYLEIIGNTKAIEVLYDYYKVSDPQSLVVACNNDWRFAIPSDIAEGNVIPRTPYVCLKDDENWFSVGELNERLKPIIESKKLERRAKRK